LKPTSIISLVVAVVLVICGLVTCMTAQNMAQSNGEYLFSEIGTENNVRTVDISESDFSKIELIAENVEINIYGRQEKSYIEFINFRDHYYSLSQSTHVLSFDEIPDVMSMLKFWENGFSFKGMRYIFNIGDDKVYENQEKVINVYLQIDTNIKIFDIKSDYCTLNIENMTSETDYNILSKEITVNTTSLRTNSSFNINNSDDVTPADVVNLNFNSTTLTNVNVNSKEIYMNTKLFRYNGEVNFVCDDGLFDLKTVTKTQRLNFDVTSESGKVTVEGAEVRSPYTHTGNESSKAILKIESKNAEINIASDIISSDDK